MPSQARVFVRLALLPAIRHRPSALSHFTIFEGPSLNELEQKKVLFQFPDASIEREKPSILLIRWLHDFMASRKHALG